MSMPKWQKPLDRFERCEISREKSNFGGMINRIALWQNCFQIGRAANHREKARRTLELQYLFLVEIRTSLGDISVPFSFLITQQRSRTFIFYGVHNLVFYRFVEERKYAGSIGVVIRHLIFVKYQTLENRARVGNVL